MPRNKLKTPEICPVCSEDVPNGAMACPKCGADHNSGWSEGPDYGGLDLPDEDFDYDEFVRQEFAPASVKPDGMKTIWWVTAIVIIIASVVLFLLAVVR